MLFINVSDQVMDQWGTTIDRYYSLHLGNLYSEIKSVNLLIEEEPLNNQEKILYRVELSLIPKAGKVIRVALERENCGDAIEQCFAKGKRFFIRRVKGIASNITEQSIQSCALGNRL